MLPFRLLATSSILLLAAAIAGPAGSPPPAASSAGKPPAAAAAPPPAGSPATPQAGPANPANPATPANPAGQATRVPLPGPDGKPFPYTIELPGGWQVQTSKTVPGLFLGPSAAGEPENDPRMIYVRVSPASLLDPEAVVANIKKSDAADDRWSAPLVEVREIGGVRGVLVRMDSGSGDQARSTLVLKMPFGQSSVDFMASAPRAEFERLLPGYQSVILSVLPVLR